MNARHESGSAARRVQVENDLAFSTALFDVRERRLADAQKEALRTTLKESAQPAKAIAMDVQMAHTRLLNCGNPSAPHELPFRKLPLVLQASDNLTLLRFYASLQGCEVFRLPTVGDGGDVHQAASAMREFAELLEAGAAAFEDVLVTPEEFARVEREAHDVVRAVLEYVAHYRARVPRPLLEGM